jgi:hypothetical protein
MAREEVMKPKQTIDPNIAGMEFKRLLADDDRANVSLKNIRSAKSARKTQLKAALTVVWEALGKGATVNGYNSREDWAKKFAGYSRRQCEYIVYGRPDRTGENANHGAQGFKMSQLDFYYYNRRKEEKSVSMMVDFEVAGSRDSGVVKLSVQVPGENVRENYDAAVKKMTALLKQVRLWNEESAKYMKEGLEEYFADVKVKPAPASKVKKVKVKTVTHRWGGVTAGGGQNSRMRDYALCGARFSGSSWTTKQRHVSVDKDETPTCPKCLKLIAEQQVSEPAQVTVVINDSPTEAHTGQHENCKECMRRHIPTDAQREQSELFNACGNLDGDDGDGNEEQL